MTYWKPGWASHSASGKPESHRLCRAPWQSLPNHRWATTHGTCWSIKWTFQVGLRGPRSHLLLKGYFLPTFTVWSDQSPRLRAQWGCSSSWCAEYGWHGSTIATGGPFAAPLDPIGHFPWSSSQFSTTHQVSLSFHKQTWSTVVVLISIRLCFSIFYFLKYLVDYLKIRLIKILYKFWTQVNNNSWDKLI